MYGNKILQIVPQLNSGGAERFVVDLSNELSASVEVMIVTQFPLETHGFYKNKVKQNVKLVSMNKKLGFNFLHLVSLFCLIRRERPEIVHTHLNSFYYALLSMLFLRRVRYFHTIHSNPSFEANNKWGIVLKRICFRFGLSTAVTISTESQKEFRNLYRVDSYLIPNGRQSFAFNSEELARANSIISGFRNTSETLIFVHIGRLNPEKNHKLLLEVFTILLDKGEDVSLLMIGAAVNSEIEKLVLSSLTDRIHYIGEVDNPRVYLACADAFCLCSTREGMPITLIEAFSVGCIPICTPAGGICDMVINANNGLVSESFDLNSYLSAIELFINMDNETRLGMRERVFKSYEEYSIEQCSNSYLNLFKLKCLE